MPVFRKVLLIANPVSGQARGRYVGGRLQQRLVERGMECELRLTTGAGDAGRWACEAGADGFDLVVAVGGDGTVQEVVGGLVRAEVRVPIAHVPLGTANVIALALGLPWTTRLSADRIAEGRTQSFDVGYLPDLDRHFFLMAAVGYPARLIADSPRRKKKLFGLFAYVAAALRQLLRSRDVSLRLSTDETVHHATAGTVLVANIGRVYRLPVTLDPATSPHDGRFDVSVISGRNVRDLVIVMARFLTLRRRPTRLLKRFSCKRVLIEADPPAPVQIDGEVIGSTPLLVEVLPQGVDFVVGAYKPPVISTT